MDYESVIDKEIEARVAQRMRDFTLSRQDDCERSYDDGYEEGYADCRAVHYRPYLDTDDDPELHLAELVRESPHFPVVGSASVFGWQVRDLAETVTPDRWRWWLLDIADHLERMEEAERKARGGDT